MIEDPSAVTAVGHAFKQVGNVNRARVSVRAGVIAAIPVAGMLALGTIVGTPTTAVVLGVGAMLSGVAWRSGDAPLVPPIGTMLAAATSIAIASLAGTLTGHWEWLHLVTLVLFCLVAGTATVLGRRGNVVGTQTVIAFIVFGRFPQSVGAAFTGAGLVLAGGLAETLFAFAIASPLAWRRQRDAVAAAYRQLAKLIGTGPALSAGPPTAAALEQADAVLSAPALFAHPRRLALSDLVDEGRRIRLELLVLNSTVLRERGRAAGAGVHGEPIAEDTLGELLRPLRESIESIADLVAGRTAAVARLRQLEGELDGSLSGRLASVSDRVEERLAAVVGQVSAAIRLAHELAPDPEPEVVATGEAIAGRSPAVRGVLPVGRPTLGSHRLRSGMLWDLRRLRESATLQSAAGRHAVRLAVVVAGTELLIQQVALPRGYWAVVAAATVLRPEFGATFTRGGERVLGTVAGAVLATLIAVGINPTGWGIVIVIAVLSCVTYAVFSASFTAGIAGLTGVIVFLLHAVAPGTVHTALDRGIDTVVGGAIGLVAYALWPTWSSMSIPRLLGTLADAQRGYLEAVVAVLVSGGPLEVSEVRPLARTARVAWVDAQTAIELARSEPRRGALDPRRAAATLGALRRVVWAVHGLRLRAADWESRPPLPLLSVLGSALVHALAVLAVGLRDPDTSDRGSLPGLRGEYRLVVWPESEPELAAIRSLLDELVDAIDTAAATAGIAVH